MMKKIITIVLLMFLIVGCDSQETAKTTTGATTAAFIGGDKGLDISFVAGAPPDEVYDVNYPFNINVRLENVGESDVVTNEAIIKIKGILPQDYNVDASNLRIQNTNELRGASLDPQGNEIAGSIDNIEFVNLQASEITGSITANILGEVCYPYTTTAVSQLCILEDLLGSTRKAGEIPFCEVNAVKDVQNSGSPVHVTNIKEAALGKDKVSISFDIAHVGSGSIYKLDTECEPSLENKNKVFVKVTTGIAGAQLSCTGLDGTQGEITLYSNTAGAEARTVICTQTLPTRTDSEKQIKVELSYRYYENVKTSLVVKHTE